MLDKLQGLDPEAVKAAAKDKKRVAQWIKDLGAADTGTRSQAAFLIAQLVAQVVAQVPEPPDTAGAKLIAQIKKEKDDAAKASLLLALGEVNRKTGSKDGTDIVDKATGMDSERTPKCPPMPVRIAAIVALARMNPIQLVPAMLDLLRAQVGLRLDAATFPWNGGDLGGIAALVLPSAEKVDVEAVLAEMKALVAAHPKPAFPALWPSEVLWPWSRVLQRALVSLGDRSKDEPLFSELTADQQALLRFGVENGIVPPMPQRGLDFQMPQAPTWPSWRRYVGLDPAGPLDRPLAVELEGKAVTAPIWKWFRKLTRAEVPAEALAAALRKALSPAEIVDLARDATFMIYGVPKEDGLTASPRSVLLHGLVEELGTSVSAPDLEGIRHVLQALRDLKAWGLKSLGWKGGPFVPAK